MHRTTRGLVVVALAATHAPAEAQNPWQVGAAAPGGFDRARAARDVRQHLERLIALNTQKPPGQELILARYFESVLAGVPGFETRVLPFTDGRANFVARLRATRPTKGAVLILGHMDTVGADPARWETPPFEAAERD